MTELNSQEIIKILDVLIGKTWAIGETNEDKKRTSNLKTLIDVVDYCLDWLLISVELQGNEYSIMENRELARQAMFEYMDWFKQRIEENDISGWNRESG